MSRLTGPEIRKRVESGDILIDPYDPDKVQAASIDLRLGPEVRVYNFSRGIRGTSPPSWAEVLRTEVLDAREENVTISYRLEEGAPVHLNPGTLYLMHTVERLHTLKYEVDVTGKSSLGRLGVIVHHTAGHVDPGFDGQYTLEVAVVHPVIVYIGMSFCQARFHTLEGEVEDYRKRGNYVGSEALGAQASRSWKQLK